MNALVGLAFGIAVATVGVYHFGFAAPNLRRLEGARGVALGPQGGASAVLGSVSDSDRQRLDRLERAYERDAYRIGFVRYNAFADVGSDQSFTLALLNGAGDGVVVTSIASREETRTYGKAVRGFAPQHGASKEEQSAIAMARTGVGV